MVTVKLDQALGVPLHEQVAAEIRRAIAAGEAGPGDRLPPAKDLAAIADVNKNTVLRALRQLREEGVLEFRRGRGVTVSGSPDRGIIYAKTRELVELAKRMGCQDDELLRLVKEATADR